MDPSTIVGTTIGEFRLTRKIGEGGMGMVYEAIHPSIKRRVAVKVLHPAIAEDREAVQRFLYEARAVNIVQHPGVVNIFGYGQLPDGAPYMIMEYLEGQSLKARLRTGTGRLPLGEAVEVGRQVADALHATHDKRIIHRDLKPDNIMLLRQRDEADGIQIKVFDFGIAKLRQEHMLEDMTLLRTQDGRIVGTPHYMAPEQCAAQHELTEKVDVYALGAVLFRCLAGRPPFLTSAPGDAGVMQLFAMHIGKQAPPLRSLLPEVPEPLSQLVATMLAKDVRERPTMALVAEALTRLLQQDLPPIVTPPPLRDEEGTWSTINPALAPGGLTLSSVDLRRRLPWRYLAGGALALIWFTLWALWALWK